MGDFDFDANHTQLQKIVRALFSEKPRDKALIEAWLKNNAEYDAAEPPSRTLNITSFPSTPMYCLLKESVEEEPFVFGKMYANAENVLAEQAEEDALWKRCEPEDKYYKWLGRHSYRCIPVKVTFEKLPEYDGYATEIRSLRRTKSMESLAHFVV